LGTNPCLIAVTLFPLASDNIKITIEAYFDDEENLIIEGYDIGKTVAEAWGDSDYEYSTTIHRDDVGKLYKAFGLPPGSKEIILLHMKNHYNTNTCYSDMQDFLEQHNIPFKGFSWM
jgi:hypothetical protein